MRLFLGIPAPAADFATWTRQLAGPDFRPVPAGSWHVTLRFLGDADPASVAQAVAPVMADREALHAVLTGPGVFGDARRARVAWIGLDAPGLSDLAADVVAATRDLGEPPEPRPFSSHITLGRWRRPFDARDFLAMAVEPIQGVLRQLVLWRSDLTPSGPVYQQQASWPLHL